MTKGKTYAPEFKAKVVLELMEGDDSLSVAAGRHGISAGMPSDWRKRPASPAASVFAQEQQARAARELEARHAREAGNLNRIVGRLTAGRDCLQRGLADGLGRRGL